MQIQIASDLHLDQDNQIHPILDCKCDMLVIAGDVYPGPKVVKHLESIYHQHHSHPHIIFVPGNHEYYGHSKKELDAFFSEYKNDHVTILNNHVLEIPEENLVFLGSTGWWDESNGQIGLQQRFALDDFKVIQDIAENNYGVDWGHASREFFMDNLNKYSKEGWKIVCLSHNGPTKKSHPHYHGSQLNRCFQNDWKHIIEDFHPEYWVFGHTHEFMRYRVGKTKCICNPMGYPWNNNSFGPDFCVHVL
jgi:predicted phosphodiesterase